MTCKDCIHYEACKDIFLQMGRIEEAAYMDDEGSHGAESECQCFKDKSRFVELPCKVGDTVYWVREKCSVPHPVCPHNGGIGVTRCKLNDEKKCLAHIREIEFGFGSLPNIGKTVFLSREEAEKKLEEMKNEPNQT